MSEPELPPIVMYGSSGYARCFQLLRDYASDTRAPYRVVAYIDDFRGGQGVSLSGVPIVTFETWRETMRDVPCLVTVGEPDNRRRLAGRLESAGGRPCKPIYPRGGWIADDLSIEEGSFITVGVWVGPSVKLGRHVQVMAMSSIGHDCNIGDFVTLAASATVGGYVTIEDGVFVGSGAVIVNGTERRHLRIGEGAKIFAGAVVTKSVPPGAKVAGNPARDLRSFVQSLTSRETFGP